jgi:hypothetical protein
VKVKAKSRTKTALGKLVSPSLLSSNTSNQLPPKSQREKEEDEYIAYLESKLGYGKTGKRKVVSEDDGLDGMSVFSSCTSALICRYDADLMDLASSLVIKPQVCLR